MHYGTRGVNATIKCYLALKLPVFPSLTVACSVPVRSR
jgi:hypothetical protein